MGIIDRIDALYADYLAVRIVCGAVVVLTATGILPALLSSAILHVLGVG